MAIWRVLALAFAVGLVTAGPALADQADKADKAAEKAAKHEGKAPEIDPAGLGGVLTMLVGGVFLFGSGRRRPR